ncbi:hypothetical protein Glove_269g57 [Diversispora epigaea]|uniref:P-type Cu(+) transporter n=1 Tax=Diversispora epigaea TaxID=1348612 RepID=A0A397I6Q3_9GLOM|nr:hypothetical protein Glove_269g57 [Diversispora epigaea]
MIPPSFECSIYSEDKFTNINENVNENDILQSIIVTDSSYNTHHYIKVSFTINGLSCAACVGSAQRVLERIDGIEPNSIDINLLLSKGSLRIEKSKLDVELIKTTIKNAGFTLEDVKVEDLNTDNTDARDLNEKNKNITTRFIVSGMTCASCVSSVKRVIEILPGIENTNVNLLTGDVIITHDPYKTGHRTLMETITNAGFTVQLNQNFLSVNATSKSIRERAEKYEKFLRKRTMLSILFSIPTFIIGMIFMMFLKDTSFTKNALGFQVFPGLNIGTLIMFLIATPVQFYIGYPFYVKSYHSIRYTRTANMDTLVALGTSVAYFGSIISVLIGIINHNDNNNMNNMNENDKKSMEGQEFFETSVLLITFIWLGRWMEAKAKGKTLDSMTKLMELQPEKADLVKIDMNNEIIEERKIDINLVQVGDIFKVNAGARIPCDGKIVKGITSIDESMITGESIPVSKSVDDIVISATLNQSSTILIKATRVGSDTTLSRIITLVQEAQSSKKAPIEELGDKISRVFVPSIISISIIVFISWLIAGSANSYPKDWIPYNENYVTFALFFAISVMVIACPCALGLASPTAIMVGTGIAAKFGILIKGGGEAIQMASKIDTIAFDKTGTLTYGKPRVIKSKMIVKTKEGVQKIDLKYLLLQIIGIVESSSDHPLAKAVTQHVMNKLSEQSDMMSMEDEKTNDQKLMKNLKNVSLVNVTEIPGKGLKAIVNVRSSICIIGEFKHPKESVNYNVFVGNEDWILEEKCTYPPSKSFEEQNLTQSWRKSGCSIVIVGLSLADDVLNNDIDNNNFSHEIVARFGILDKPRPEARSTISTLKSMGIDVWMITGDHPIAAKAIASRLKIKNVLAKVTPEVKAQTIKWLQQRNSSSTSNKSKKSSVVAMIGDGINDSLALTQADLGISISSASDIAIESSSIILTRSTLYSLITMIVLSKEIIKRIRINFIWAFMYNLCSIPIAAGVFFPIFKVGLPPALAGLLMSTPLIITPVLVPRPY